MEIDRELPSSLNAALERITPPPFPTEILLDIFEFASIASAKTALALCLVSKEFNALATPFLYRSISACGHGEMLVLIDRFEKNTHFPPMVRNLFLAQCGPRDYKKIVFDVQPDEPLLLSDASRRIITLLSPFLEALSYIVSSISDEVSFTKIFATPFPRLCELTIEGRQLRFPIPIPSLERLHIYTQRCYVVICDLGDLCSQLTHLKLTDIAHDGESIEIGLKRNRGIPMSEWEIERMERIAPLYLPNSLGCLILQPMNFRRGFCAPGLPYRLGGLWERLVELGQTGLLDPMVLRLEEPIDRALYCGRAYEDWLDRIGCGEGCWKSGGPKKRK